MFSGIHAAACTQCDAKSATDYFQKSKREGGKEDSIRREGRKSPLCLSKTGRCIFYDLANILPQIKLN